MDNMIQWFPGHMKKALRNMEADLALADLIIYVLDSRAPYSCINPVFNSMIALKPIIYVLNKADLGSRSLVSDWLEYLSGENSCAVAIDSTTSQSAKIITSLAQKMCVKKLEKYSSKGVKATVRAMVIGVPNSGKSTLINNLCGQGKTTTGNRPGVTRGKQWVRINNYFEVLDTPGTLYPKLSNQHIARHLAYIGSIKDEITDTHALSLEFLKELNSIDENILKARYKVEFVDAEDALNQIAKNRGFVIKGGELDLERAALALFDDFRKGRLGNITLDKVGLGEQYDEN